MEASANKRFVMRYNDDTTDNSDDKANNKNDDDKAEDTDKHDGDNLSEGETPDKEDESYSYPL